MPPEEPIAKSPLDRPLNQLTEDDISQLTREDCRRYLKEKGMRRPSWNKSQAIQQVISLKTLLEATPGSEAGGRKKLYIPPSDTPHGPKGSSADAEISESAEETVPYRRKDPEKPDLSGDLTGRVVPAANDSASPRTTGSADIPVGQMTIFYCGKVNVYDDVPADKARAIMHLAATPLHLLPETPVDGTVKQQPQTCRMQTANVKSGTDSAGVFLPNLQAVKMSDNSRLHVEERNRFHEDSPVEGSASRKALVQRYREKRKDR